MSKINFLLATLSSNNLRLYYLQIMDDTMSSNEERISYLKKNDLWIEQINSAQKKEKHSLT